MLFETFPKLKRGLHFGQNMLTLNELIGYVDLRIAVKFGNNIWRIVTNKTVSGNFDIQNIFPIATIYATRLKYFCLL